MGPSCTLENLAFDNACLRSLPVEDVVEDCREPETRQKIRRGVCFSRLLGPREKLVEPVTVAVSLDALDLLSIPDSEVARPDFADFFSGNAVFPGSEPAAHCYAGHQFGHFAGQLGDGAVMYLGEADGRKVLRSSIREFLASEALFHLGIPTTRAGSLVTSATRIVRDPLYRGEAVEEQAAVVLRLAPSFLRFGSFEICRATDSTTGRAGPSHGLQLEMLPKMLHYTIQTFFPDIWRDHQHGVASAAEGGGTAALQDMYCAFYREVLLRTAALVAAWQCVGWCHGVLNTDNMSVLGLTIDYGPFGFLDRYDPDHVCNLSDDSGRYRYSAQPAMCRENCQKLAEALKDVVPESRLRPLEPQFEAEYTRCYHGGMMRKLGLLALDEGKDDVQLVKDLLTCMEQSGADWTFTFRLLCDAPEPHPDADDAASDAALAPVLDAILDSLPGPIALAAALKPRMPLDSLRMLSMLYAREGKLFAGFGMEGKEIAKAIARHAKAAEIAAISEEEHRQINRDRWRTWLRRYSARLRRELAAGGTTEQRCATQRSCNPRFVLRNWIAQQAIECAERGDFTEVRRVLALLRMPFATDAQLQQSAHELDRDRLARSPCVPPPPDTSRDSDGLGQPELQLPLLAPNGHPYDAIPPPEASSLCVSCSS